MSYAPAGAVLKEVHYKEPGPRTAIDLISTSQLIWLSANEPVLFPGEFLKKYMLVFTITNIWNLFIPASAAI